MDETGWRTAGQRRALWGIFDQRHAYLHVAADRHEDHAKELLADTKAVVTSDRWWAYNHLPLARRQLCWAHLARDFKAHAEGHGRREASSASTACASASACSGPGRSSSTPTTAASSRPRSAELQREFKPIVRRYAGKSPRYKYCRGIARNLLKAWPALWTFANHPGVEPTNNHAERALRGAVIYRKLSLGSQSPATANNASHACSAPTPPADYNAAPCSPTSPTPSPPTPAATQCPCSPEPTH